MTSVLIRRKKFGHKNTGRRPYKDGSRNCSNASMSQGIMRIASNSRSWKSQADIFFQCLQRKHGPLRPWFQISVYGTVREKNFCYFQPPSVFFSLLNPFPGKASCHVMQWSCTKFLMARDWGLLIATWVSTKADTQCHTRVFRWNQSPDQQLDCNFKRNTEPQVPS